MLKKELFNDCAQFNLMMEKWQMEEHFIIFFLYNVKSKFISAFRALCKLKIISASCVYATTLVLVYFNSQPVNVTLEIVATNNAKKK